MRLHDCEVTVTAPPARGRGGRDRSLVKLGKNDGITGWTLREGRQIAGLAERLGAEVAPHLYAGPTEWAANLGLAAAFPNISMAESTDTPFQAALIDHKLKIEAGHTDAPGPPGLGIEVDEAPARVHPDRGKGRHLHMQEAHNSYSEANRFAGGAPSSARDLEIVRNGRHTRPTSRDRNP